MHKFNIGDVVSVVDARRGDRHGAYDNAGDNKSVGSYDYLFGKECPITGK